MVSLGSHQGGHAEVSSRATGPGPPLALPTTEHAHTGCYLVIWRVGEGRGMGWLWGASAGQREDGSHWFAPALVAIGSQRCVSMCCALLPHIASPEIFCVPWEEGNT
jgi:hypothetical protein